MVLKNPARLTFNKTSFVEAIIPGLKAVLIYFTFWIAYFILFRAAFLLYHFDKTVNLAAGLIPGIFIHGLKMDVSFGAYLCMLLLIILAISLFLTPKSTATTVSWFTGFFLILISIISVADLELFREWGFRLDATPLTYLGTPMEMAASIASSPYVLLSLSILSVIFLGFRVYQKTVLNTLKSLPPTKWPQSICYLMLAVLMIIPIRGGFQLAPMNQSTVFFSKNDFANQAAINIPWNFFWSFSKELYSSENPYLYMPANEAKNLVSNYYSTSGTDHKKILNTITPNIIIIVWESFTSKVVPDLGGKFSDVVPEFEKLIHEGILFKNFYANGERSAKGLVAILSGFPPQPKRSIIKIPSKSSQLPVITKPLIDRDYHTGFYHGGELEFANIKSYLLGAHFNTIVGKKDFSDRDMNSKWGAHDHVLLEKAFSQINRQQQPFFEMIFTLSSHEPFEIPVVSRFPGEDLENLYKSSLSYTDQSIGKFIQDSKTQPWYENTLIIIVADHGHRLLDNTPRYHKSRYHIPMLWLGGALMVTDSVVSKTCSQTDLSKTLLTQLDMDSSSFPWSKDIFDLNNRGGAFYTFNDGIGFINGQTELIFDHTSRNVLKRSPIMEQENLSLVKAHLQTSFQDYLNK